MTIRSQPIVRCLVLPLIAWACSPVAAQAGEPATTPATTPCRLQAIPDAPLVRGRNTCLLASFDMAETNDAEFARVERREVGLRAECDASGRLGGGVAVVGAEGCVMYPGLDNYDPRRGTVEFWAQSCAGAPIWTDAKEHWLLVLFPERAGAAARYGMAPYFVTLGKTAGNTLELRIVNASVG